MLARVDECYRYRTIWISDIHLGTPGCQAYYLLDFLRTHRVPTRSTWSATSSTAGSCRSGWYWPQAHNDVVQKLLRKARKGTQVVYIPGNHDELAAPVHRPRSSAASTSPRTPST